MEENVTALTTGILPARHFWGKPSTQMSRTLFTELPPKKAVEVLWDALSTASESSSSLEKLFKRLDPDTWTEEQRNAICSSGWPMHASLLFADFGARQDEWNEAGVQAWWSSMPEPLALLSKLHPEHQDVWRASWENCSWRYPTRMERFVTIWRRCLTRLQQRTAHRRVLLTRVCAPLLTRSDAVLWCF